MTKRRLIESGLPLAEVNAESAREKSLRHGHISTMHLWWARRPLAMSRTVVFASLLPDPPEASARADILKSIAQASSLEDSIKPERINPLKGLLAEAFGRPPRVLDCFAGGGAIPLESLRLGCDTTALDLNPVAHLIQRCVLEYPQLFGDAHGLEDNRLASEVVQWADWVRRRAEPRIAEVFPPDADGDRPAVYFWAHTMRCSNPSCGAEVPLLSSFWLANSSRRLAWVEASTGSTGIVLRVRSGAPPASHPTDAGTMRAASMTCPACETTTPAKEVRAYARKTGFGRRLYAVLDVSSRVRTYRAPRPEESWECLADRVTPLLDQLEDTADGTSAIPDEPVDSIGYINLQNLVYGYDTWRSLFSPRQLLVLGTLAESVRAAHVEMLASGLEPARARAIATYLGFLVDKIADYDSEFTSWRTTAEASRSTFPRQAISIAWDFIEIYPFHPDSDVWGAHVRWLELAIRHCSMTGNTPARVVRGDAQSLPFEDETFDAVVIDPPYYFSVMYSDLSDFFYVWLKRSVGHLYPDEFLTQWTPKDQEVIQNRTNPKDPRYISSEEFERRLERSLREVVRVVRRDGVVSIVFAHTDVVAWERLLRSLQAVGLVVSTSWPMRSERAGRQLAQVKAALGSSVVLVCRPQETAEEGFYDDVVRELETRLADRLATFEEMQLIGADYFISAIGPAFEVFARYSRVVRLSGEAVRVDELMVLARQAVARHAIRRLLGGENLTALDKRSLLYLTWRWAYDGEAIPADEAYKLGRAFDIDLTDLARPGDLIAKTGDSFRLLAPHERKDPKLSTTPSLIDVLHLAAQFHDAGRRNELAELLGATGMGGEPGFWATATAIAQSLPDGNRERTMLLGLTGNKDQLAQAAAKHVGTLIEDLTLFENS